MPHSHHSHSGEFCNHATDTLRSMLSTAHAAHMTTYALTEHCPRGNKHLYPGEAAAGYDSVRQKQVYADFFAEATQLREEYEGKGVCVLVGFEAEWIVEVESEEVVRGLEREFEIDFFVGSVHFVREVAIDYSREVYEEVRGLCGGEEALFLEYFAAQAEMLRVLRPVVVGHFDLIRLFADEKDGDWRGMGRVWEGIVRNLEIVKGYGGVLEINTSALRKGLEQPYPRREIVEQWDEMGGLCVLSDDAHAVGHVGTNYGRALDFIKEVGLKELAYLDKGKDGVEIKTMTIEALEQHPYWKR